MSNEVLAKLMRRVHYLANERKYKYIVSEMALYCMLDDRRIQEILKRCNADIDGIRRDTEEFLSGMETVNSGKFFADRVILTDDYKKTLESVSHYAIMNISNVKPEHVLLAILENDRDSFAAYTLRKYGITQEVLEKFKEVETEEESTRFLEDMVPKAKRGEFDPCIGRAEELERLVQVLHKKRSCNPILVSNPGVGKTSIVEGLAQRIADGNVPDTLKNSSLYLIDLAGMVAGTKFRGEFEERMKQTLNRATEEKGAILFIDEVHTIIGAGSSQENSLDVANILKPYLSSGKLRLIGATTYEEYKKLQKDKALSRRFQKIDVREPSEEETLEILKGLRPRYQEFHGVEYSDEVLSGIVSLSGKYLQEKYFPDKAVEVMDEVGSRYHAKLSVGESATMMDVENVICRIANLPSIELKQNEASSLKTLAFDVKRELYNQDEIVDSIVRHIKNAKAGFTSKNKPLGVFGLAGSTGTGKTELVKQLASHLGMEFVRFDMSEYSERGSVSKLVGTSPGYVGFEQAGGLTEPILRNPNSIILFDEIEKADPSIYNLLLQVMDEGRLTDNNNRLVDFRKCILFFTSNVGSVAAEAASQSLGFFSYSRKEEVLEKEMKATFSPEFRNRFTEIYRFHDLNMLGIHKIVEKELRRVEENLKEKNIQLVVTETVKDILTKQAWDEGMGGRPVERIVNTQIAERLVDGILFDGLKDTRVQFLEKDGEIIWREIERKG